MFLGDIIPFVDGIDLQKDTATATFNTGSHGFNFPSAANVLAVDKECSDDTEGPRFTLAVTQEVVGGHANGPGQTRAALWLYSGKKDHLTTSEPGEIDGGYILAEQGNKDDVGGLLVGVSKVFGGVGDTGGAVGVEFSTKRVSPSGSMTEEVHGVLGLEEGLGGALNGSGASFYAETFAGTPTAAFAGVNNAGTFKYLLAGYTARNPANMYFHVKWDGQTSVSWGGPTDNMQIRYDGSINTMFWRDQTNSFNAAALTKTGEFSAKSGIRVSDASVLVRRYLRSKLSVDFQNVPAHNTERVDVWVSGACMDDGVSVNPTSNYVNDKLIITGRVWAPNIVRLTAHNIGTTDIDPGPQDVIIWVKGV